MATTSPARIEDDLYASAKLAGDALSRSASQQIAHWARIGREIQASASISHREIADVLAGRSSYDGLDPKEQAVVRAEWAERMAVYRSELDLAAQFVAQGRSWVELDAGGHVVERSRPAVARAGTAGGRSKAAKKAAKPALKKPAKKAARASAKASGKAATRKVAKSAVPRSGTTRRATRARAAS